MNLTTLPMPLLLAKAEARPPGYLDALLACAVGRNGDDVTFDVDSEAWRTLRAKYRDRPEPSSPAAAAGCPGGCGGDATGGDGDVRRRVTLTPAQKGRGSVPLVLKRIDISPSMRQPVSVVGIARYLTYSHIFVESSSMKAKPLTEQIRKAIDGSGMTRYAIGKATGIDQATLSRFMSGKAGLSLPNLDKIGQLLRLQLTSAPTRKAD